MKNGQVVLIDGTFRRTGASNKHGFTEAIALGYSGSDYVE
jgi:hypothetical protein